MSKFAALWIISHLMFWQVLHTWAFPNKLSMCKLHQMLSNLNPVHSDSNLQPHSNRKSFIFSKSWWFVVTSVQWWLVSCKIMLLSTFYCSIPDLLYTYCIHTHTVFHSQLKTFVKKMGHSKELSEFKCGTVIGCQHWNKSVCKMSTLLDIPWSIVSGESESILEQ